MALPMPTEAKQLTSTTNPLETLLWNRLLLVGFGSTFYTPFFAQKPIFQKSGRQAEWNSSSERSPYWLLGSLPTFEECPALRKENGLGRQINSRLRVGSSGVKKPVKNMNQFVGAKTFLPSFSRLARWYALNRPPKMSLDGGISWSLTLFSALV